MRIKEKFERLNDRKIFPPVFREYRKSNFETNKKFERNFFHRIKSLSTSPFHRINSRKYKFSRTSFSVKEFSKKIFPSRPFIFENNHRGIKRKTQKFQSFFSKAAIFTFNKDFKRFSWHVFQKNMYTHKITKNSSRFNSRPKQNCNHRDDILHVARVERIGTGRIWNSYLVARFPDTCSAYARCCSRISSKSV